MPDARVERFWMGVGTKPSQVEGLERALEVAFSEGRAAWPELDTDPLDFAEYLGRKAGSGAAGLEGLRAPDLYLAQALERGEAVAVRCLERLVAQDLPAVIAAIPSLRAHADDLRQILLERLLVPPPERALPRIAEYSGRGSLRGWVRVSLTRIALNLAQRSPKELELEDDEALFQPEGGAPDPELAQMRQLYQADFKAVLKETIGGLTPHERNLLRHRYLDGLQVDNIAAIYGVHRVTAARQLAKARDGLQAGLKARVAERWKLTPSEAASLARMMRSELHLSLRGVFASRPSGPGSGSDGGGTPG